MRTILGVILASLICVSPVVKTAEVVDAHADWCEGSMMSIENDAYDTHDAASAASNLELENVYEF